MDKHVNVDYKALGARIRKKRLQSGQTQGQVAEALELSESFYSRIECGTRVLSVDSLVRISNYYGLSLDYLLLDSTDGDTKLSTEIDNIFRGKNPEQTALLLNLLKIQAENIDKIRTTS